MACNDYCPFDCQGRACDEDPNDPKGPCLKPSYAVDGDGVRYCIVCGFLEIAHASETPRRRKLTDNQEDLLRHIASGGQPAEWQVAGDMRCSGALAFYAREEVINSLLKRGLIVWVNDCEITDAGSALLRGLDGAR